MSKDNWIKDAQELLSRYKSHIILGIFGIYLILLFIGLIAELFDIEPILDWWIWSPPGKFK